MEILDKNNDHDDFLRKWEEKRAQGKWRYIIMDGMFGWGITVALLASMLRLLFFDPTISSLMTGMVLFIGAGFVFGWLMWGILEKRYETKKDKLSNFQKEELGSIPTLSSLKPTAEDLPKEMEMKGRIVEVPVINKVGREIEGMASLFLQLGEDERYFIKLSSGKVLRDDLEKYLDQPIKVMAYKTYGQWDSDDPKVQSRVGNYVVISKTL